MDMTKAREIVRTHGLKSEYVDPGGRALTFTDGRALRLTDMCNACDSAAIERFFA